MGGVGSLPGGREDWETFLEDREGSERTRKVGSPSLLGR